MKHTSLIQRDPAKAILLGVYDTPEPAADFGGEFDFGSEFSQMLDAGAEFEFGDDDDDFGDDDDDEDDFGARRRRRGRKRVSAQKAMAMVNRAMQQRQRAIRRGMLMNPNAGSPIKVEKYSFNLSQALVLGAALAIGISDQPDVSIRPKRIVMNTPWPGFATITSLRLANVNVTIGTGVADASSWAGGTFDTDLDLPTLSPAQRANIQGQYTGFVPPGYVGANPFTFVTQMIGPATFSA